MGKFVAAVVASLGLFIGAAQGEEVSRAERLALLGAASADQLGDRWIVAVEDYTPTSEFCKSLVSAVKERCAEGSEKKSLRGENNVQSLEDSDASDFDDTCVIAFQCDFENVIAQGKLDDLFEAAELEQDSSVVVDESEDQGDGEDESEDESIEGGHRRLGSSKKKQWGLERISKPGKGTNKAFSYEPEFTGQGVDVYVVDTGVNSKHNEFEGRYTFGYSAIKGESDEDGHGHGSHVAGIVAGKTFGVAPEASIIGVKVFDARGQGPISNIVSGINWSVKHFKKNSKKNEKSAILNLSIQAGKGEKALKKAVKSAVKAGLIVVVAAGNLSMDACSTNPAVLGGKAKSSDGVITVMASDKKDARGSYSNYGKCTDIFAPGSNIVSAWKGGANASHKMSGTSQAAPHVAGVAAQLLQKNNYEKHAAQSELFEIGVWNKISDELTGSTDYLLQKARK